MAEGGSSSFVQPAIPRFNGHYDHWAMLIIFYKKDGCTNLVAYTDNDFAGDLDDRRSTSGFAFLLGSGAVSWSSKK